MTLTVKACFDVAGWVTHAGSRVLADEAAATADAPVVSALREAGAVLLAQTNMTEFAYGALGLNDAYGTPTTPLYPHEHRVSGGSTSGGAVAVSLGIADMSLGSDTSGSVRIPAAFCGVAGFKPSRGRYPDEAMVHLSPSFDVPGIVATSAEMCRQVDAALTDRRAATLNATSSLSGLRLVVPDQITVDGVDPTIVDAFEQWIAALADGGARVTRRPLACLGESASAAREGGIIPAEAYMLHRDRLQSLGHLYDPRVGPRIAAGADVRAHHYAAGLRRLRVLAQTYDNDMIDADAVLTPTVAIIPPRIADLQTNDAYLATNAQAFRLTEYANRLDLPSISVPGDLANRRPMGLLITGKRWRDVQLLDVAVQIERCLSLP
jgi:amidase/aspartyl-tRNA(Asn)/glutamyl-tRNA(Gln) amidotransferase subunit A